MFCPNCGTQNAEGVTTCAKCSFNLSGGGAAPAAPPKFKGTMLMMNPQPGAPPAPSGSGEAAPPSGPPRAAPGKLKGTMVGVAPPVGGAASQPQQPVAAPAQDWAPPAAPEWNQQPVNPLGGTMAADGAFGAAPPNPDPYAATAAPPQDWQQQAPAGGYGAPAAAPQDQWGQQQAAPMGGGYGAPPAAPQDQWGAPPAAAPQDQWGQAPGGMAPAAPQDQWGQAAGAVGGAMAGAAGAVDQWGQQAAAGMGGMVPYGGGQQQMQGMGGGQKGQVRNGLMVLLIGFVTLGIYQLIWFFTIAGEVNRFLGRDAIPAGKILLLSIVTCNLYGLYWQFSECGKVIQEVQQRAGMANAQNHGFMYLIPYYNVILMQDELNKAWNALP
ncbi:MAG: DUF4234 domain-containing protein [Polyangiaceae bacterium]